MSSQASWVYCWDSSSEATFLKATRWSLSSGFKVSSEKKAIGEPSSTLFGLLAMRLARVLFWTRKKTRWSPPLKGRTTSGVAGTDPFGKTTVARSKAAAKDPGGGGGG